MQDEYFDIVDEDDNVVGRCTRKEAHNKGILHRSVIFFIMDKKARIFVNKRTMNKHFYPGYYSVTFGGHVGSGESYGKTVLREVKEEAGISGKPVFLDSFKKRTEKLDKENMNVYAFITEEQPKVDGTEIEYGNFMTIEQAEELMKKENFLPEAKDMLRILKKNKGKIKTYLP